MTSRDVQLKTERAMSVRQQQKIEELRAEVKEAWAKALDCAEERNRLRAEIESVRAALATEMRFHDIAATEVNRLRAAVINARDQLARNQPQSIADCDGDAWEAWAILEAVLHDQPTLYDPPTLYSMPIIEADDVPSLERIEFDGQV